MLELLRNGFVCNRCRLFIRGLGPLFVASSGLWAFVASSGLWAFVASSGLWAFVEDMAV